MLAIRKLLGLLWPGSACGRLRTRQSARSVSRNLNMFRLQIVIYRRQSWVVANSVHTAPPDCRVSSRRRRCDLSNCSRRGQFLPRDACVCLSVCLSQVGVLLKRLNVGSHKQHHTIAQDSSFLNLSLVMSERSLWAWSGWRYQFLHCGLRKFRHSKSSVYRWYPQLVRGRFVHDTYRTIKATPSRHGWVHMFITHCLTVTL